MFDENTLTSKIAFVTVHVIDADVKFCDGTVKPTN